MPPPRTQSLSCRCPRSARSCASTLLAHPWSRAIFATHYAKELLPSITVRSHPEAAVRPWDLVDSPDRPGLSYTRVQISQNSFQNKPVLTTIHREPIHGV
ncbi:hypothetical protein FKP32DRAFT_345429 [Trametes sanguinea]|nr:hypothetical protein FKP32DRAFT_345429 [Trametes sanguinea]